MGRRLITALLAVAALTAGCARAADPVDQAALERDAAAREVAAATGPLAGCVPLTEGGR